MTLFVSKGDVAGLDWDVFLRIGALRFSDSSYLRSIRIIRVARALRGVRVIRLIHYIGALRTLVHLCCISACVCKSTM